MSERNGNGTAPPKVGGYRLGNAGKGRPKGSVNKTTASVKAALMEAFDKRGGVKALIEWANDQPTEFYKLWGRLAPTEVQADVKGGLVIRVVRE
jgi:hypothetical protein